MRVVRAESYGGPSVLRLDDVPAPSPGPGQVSVRVRGAGVNPVDYKIRSGAMGDDPARLPWVPGIDVAGTVTALGDGVTDVAVGDEVLGFAVSGGYAEEAVVAQRVARPGWLDAVEAAGWPVVVETAGRVLSLLGLDAPGDDRVVVVTAVAGGVGSAVTQLAVARGYRVVGVGGEAGRERALGDGASAVTGYGEGLAARLRDLAPDGVAGAVDAAGRGLLGELVAVAGSPDRVVTVADMSAGEHGVRFSAGGAERSTASLEEALRLAADGRFRLPVARTYPLGEAVQAHADLENGNVRGKVVLVP